MYVSWGTKENKKGIQSKPAPSIISLIVKSSPVPWECCESLRMASFQGEHIIHPQTGTFRVKAGTTNHWARQSINLDKTGHLFTLLHMETENELLSKRSICEFVRLIVLFVACTSLLHAWVGLNGSPVKGPRPVPWNLWMWAYLQKGLLHMGWS